MKRFGYAAGAVVLTSLLVMLAISIAQRDARTGDSTPNDVNLPYANQTAQPISLAENATAEATGASAAWPPAPIIRGNDPDSDHLPPTSASSLPPVNAALTSYASPSYSGGSEPDNVPTLTSLPPVGGVPQDERGQTRKFAEPPPLVDSNSFSNSFPNSVSPPTTLARTSESPLANAPNLPPTFPPSLPSQSNARSVSPGIQNQPQTSQNNLPSTAMPSTLPPSSAPPSAMLPSTSIPGDIASSPFAAPSLGPISRNGQASVSAGANDSNATNLPALPSNPLPPANTPPPIATLGAPQPTTPTISSIPSETRSATDANIPPATRSVNTTAPTSIPYSSATRSPSNSTIASTSTIVSSAPGMRILDGSQNPSMEIQKRAPNEVQVGVACTFTILVRNVGNATAYDVQVVDAVPKGAKLVRTSPSAQVGAEQSLLWKLGEMPAGAEQILSIELIPETEGEIGSVASVNFAAQASVRTISTQPKLTVKQLFEPVILGGETMRIMIEVANIGTGTARNVRLQEDVPAIFRHATGSSTLELSLYDLAPGETVKQDIDLTAVSAGKATNLMRAISDNAATSESAAQIEVVAPKLAVSIEGASLRYLERQVTYRIAIHNTGTAIARDIDLTLYLPSGLQFNSTINQGSYVPKQHAVYWSLSELAAGAHVTTEVTLLPVEEGNYVLRMQCQAKDVRAEPIEKPVRIEGQSELAFSIEDDNDPIETDGRTTYLVRISNIGTRNDNNVELQLELPEGAVVEQVNAPVEYRVSQRLVVFSPIPQLSAKDQHTIRVLVRHAREGIHVVRAQLKSKLRPTPVSKEESTEVYRDR